MNKAKRSKNFTYYFRIEFSSLQGKITTGFCGLGIISVILMFITATLLKPALERSEYLNRTILPTRHQASLLEKNLQLMLLTGKDAHIRQNTVLPQQVMDNFTGSIREPLDSLQNLSQNWHDRELELSMQQIALKAGNLLNKFAAINNHRNPSLQSQFYQEDADRQLSEISKKLSLIVQKQRATEETYLAFIEDRNENMFSILAFCFVVAFAIGSMVGSFIVLQVLNVIRHLKYKILELSEGKLIDPIPSARNELNSIGKAINILTDNLRDIREFALKVGKGDFDSQISVFDNQGDLGSSLAEMRDSLKRVADEEKIRTWTAEGLARFNEHLRQSSEELDSFASTFISKLVKFLELNQGAFYILNQEDEAKPKLELKGCFAFDRQKYLEKSLEPGQGLVGQAFLEKEYILLNNVPEQYLSITSGLGESSARFLIIMPVKINEEVLGVLELASFRELPAYKISFLEKLSESIAAAISRVHTSHMTSRLLHEAQEMAESMKLQEEMLRQNSEELMATQEKLERDIQELNESLQFSEAALDNTLNPHIIVDQHKRIRHLNKAAELLFKLKAENMKQQHINDIIGEGLNNSTYTLFLQGEEYQLHRKLFSTGEQEFESISLIPVLNKSLSKI